MKAARWWASIFRHRHSRSPGKRLPYGTGAGHLRHAMPGFPLDGIRNLGGMVHFTEPELHRCPAEVRRILKPVGSMILFWLAERDSSRWILADRTWGRV